MLSTHNCHTRAVTKKIDVCADQMVPGLAQSDIGRKPGLEHVSVARRVL